MRVAKSGRKWILIGAEDSWAEKRSFPTKWKAEVAMEVIGKGGRVSDYFAEARKVGRSRPGQDSASVGGDWKRFRTLPHSIEVDFHYSDLGPRELPYWKAMDNIGKEAMEALVKAYELGLSYVIFTHGSSTSGPGKSTARSEVRGLIKSTQSTPYVIKSKSIQHGTVFVAAIRPNPIAPRLPEIPDCPKCHSDQIEMRANVGGAGRFKCDRKGCKHLFTWFEWKQAGTETP